MKLISGAKYAALQTKLQRTEKNAEDAEKLAADRLTTIGRLRTERDQLRDAKPNSPVQQPQPMLGDAELRRQLGLARRTIRELDERLTEMQASHIADTRELHDLRQAGGRS
ncbi:hypothetical protein [Streptomyces sp. DSM 40750]|uniref:hypothetical protein n=1 Tax=Streptomyces sp. DSM 40750 TaxID=2801030 RepID=UPI00214C8582|nr:hypothetical protein [Streptomyces sp. DSM 40750]UUU21680.1 hypothetical protein JIX55_15860 [Streptomyces sp. DSM 40750]